MIYRVVDGSTDIYGDLQGTVLLDPSLKLELNAAGSFSFKVPPVHDYYGKIKALTDTINVYEDDDLIFTGRPTEIKNDWFNQKKSIAKEHLRILMILFNVRKNTLL